MQKIPRKRDKDSRRERHKRGCKNTKEKEIGTIQEICKTSKDEKKEESSKAKHAAKEDKKSFGDVVPHEFV